MGTYAMHSVHFEINDENGLHFKAKNGNPKVKVLITGPWKEYEMTREEFDAFLGELEGLRDRMWG